jgi:hypothetical protein
VAVSRSENLRDWSPPRPLTPQDPSLNFSSPGNVVRHGGEWVMCLQTYPRQNGEKYGSAASRLWTMRSRDLHHWTEPQLLRVKGPDVPNDAAGRMIDPFLYEDPARPGRWWCFFKQNGVSASWSDDLQTWHFAGHTEAGENACVFRDGDDHVLLHSPENGIGLKRSRDLKTWTDAGLLTLGQADWPWARGRITAGFALDLRSDPRFKTCLLFFHGSGPEDERTMFDHNASIGLAWSDDLLTWRWPGCQTPQRLAAAL